MLGFVLSFETYDSGSVGYEWVMMSHDSLFALSITAVLHPPAPSSLISPFLPLTLLSRVTCDTAWQTDVWQLHTVCANSGLSCKWSTFYPALSKHPTINQVANMFHQQSTQITLWMNLKPKPSGVPHSRSSHEGSLTPTLFQEFCKLVRTYDIVSV